jgi:predicted outer membrane repeat protein
VRSTLVLSWRVGVLALLIAMPVPAANVTVTVPPGDVSALRTAILGANQLPNVPGSTTIINVSGTYTLTQPLPNVTGSVVIVGNFAGSGGSPATRIEAGGAGFPAATVGGGGLLKLAGLEVSGFSVTGNGGAIRVTGGEFQASGVLFANNTATGDGGAVDFSGDATGSITDCTFTNNRAARGGGISTTSGTSVSLETSQLSNNTATVFGCDVNSDGNGGIAIGNSQLSGNCANVRVEDPRGPVTVTGSTIVAPSPGVAIDSTASATLANNAFLGGTVPRQSAAKVLCQDFGSGAFRSLGGNIATDASCFLNQPTDRPNTDPQLAAPGADGVIAPRDGSPALESGPSALLTLPNGSRRLPCGYKDLRGLGRPQDLNNDGIFACDAGVIEKQSGAAIGAPQTTAVYDPARVGEGTFIEMLDDNQVWVGTFTYTPAGGLAWFVGLGKAVGNSAVLDEMLVASGGVFGAAYDPNRVALTRVGGASFVFPTCEAVTRPGSFAFQAARGSGYEDQLSKSLRLTQVLPCTGAAPANSGRSGSFYSPSRAYEGIFVEWLSDGRVLLIWYTWDPQGRQFWTISDAVTVTGNRLTAQMIYASQPTRFGSNFNPGQIVFAPWGTVTLTYNDCNNVSFAYNSTVPGFGSGNYAYARLTQPRGGACAP